MQIMQQKRINLFDLHANLRANKCKAEGQQVGERGELMDSYIGLAIVNLLAYTAQTQLQPQPCARPVPASALQHV